MDVAPSSPVVVHSAVHAQWMRFNHTWYNVMSARSCPMQHAELSSEPPPSDMRRQVQRYYLSSPPGVHVTGNHPHPNERCAIAITVNR